nr:patatin-like phospholipase family protein [Ruegeria sp. HKCCE3926]
MRTYCVFEGGGAKGYAHIGVLRAIEAEDFDIKGYAGTSAGAIVATLACVGYSSSELVDPTSRSHLLHQVVGEGSRPFKLLGPGGWLIRLLAGGSWTAAVVAFLLYWMSLPLVVVVLLLWVFLFCILKLTSILPVIGSWIGEPARPSWGTIRAYWAKARDCVERRVSGYVLWVKGFLVFVFYFCLFQATGLSNTKSAKSALEAAIEAKLPGFGHATFEELKSITGKELRIVAANISTRRLKLFSAEETPDVIVSEAVSASIAIPGVFSPVEIEVPRGALGTTEKCLFVDGGIVSNLPAWVFDDERLIDREAITILSEIVDAPAKSPKKNFFSILAPIARTSVFGASRLNVRSIGRTLPLSLPIERDIFDFEPAWTALGQELDDVQNIASIVFNDDRAIDSWLEALQAYLDEVCKNHGLSDGRVRAALATASRAEPYVLEYADDVIQLRFCQGYDADSDYRQALSFERSLLGETFREEYERRTDKFGSSDTAPQGYFVSRESFPDGVISNDPRDVRMVSQIPPSLKWWIFIPLRILNPSFPYIDIALCFDGSYSFSSSETRNAVLQSILDYAIETIPAEMSG